MKNRNMVSYYEALERIITGKTLIVGPIDKISLRSVAIEAGKSAGAIKKSRPIYRDLISAIMLAAEKNDNKRSDSERALEKIQNELNRYRNLYQESLAREVVLMSQLLKK